MLLRERLQKQSDVLFARLITIERVARQLVEYSQGGEHLTFTPHGLSHISGVESNYEWILSKSDLEEFNELEIFCLLCSTFFHDAFMIPKRLGFERQSRLTHAIDVGKKLYKDKDIIGLDIHEINVIAEVIKGHSVMSFSEIKENGALGRFMIDIHKLAACLSLADICHADKSRAPEIVFRYLEHDAESKRHWKRHLMISGIARKNDHIYMSAAYFTDDGYNALVEYKEDIEKQLKIISPFFQTKLNPLIGVDFDVQYLASYLDVPLRFQANTPAILDILIEGVYQRNDVFIRETIQNSLDACHLRMAKCLKRCEKYDPKIVISSFEEDGLTKIVRIDDNGLGMDAGDISDILLWIGNSVSKKADISSLLQETTAKDLIATFGIGVLSCFKVSKSIIVRTKKENSEAIEIELKSVAGEINLTKSTDETTGTTFIIKLEDNSDIDVEISLDHYIVSVKQAEVSRMSLANEEIVKHNRDNIFNSAAKNGAKIKMSAPYRPAMTLAAYEIKADDYIAEFWLPKDGRGDSFSCKEGSVTILNEGIFVSKEDTDLTPLIEPVLA